MATETRINDATTEIVWTNEDLFRDAYKAAQRGAPQDFEYFLANATNIPNAMRRGIECGLRDRGVVLTSPA